LALSLPLWKISLNFAKNKHERHVNGVSESPVRKAARHRQSHGRLLALSAVINRDLQQVADKGKIETITWQG
jgi:hypothetical protein